VVIAPIVEGVAATVAATAALLAWVAIGSLLLRRVRAANMLFLPGSLLVGAGLTGTVLAIVSRLGWVREGTLAVALVSLGILFIQRRAVADQVGSGARTVRDAVRDWPRVRWFLFPLAVTAWVCAIAPPRDGDVMRYHLAHVRQIISDGGWKPIADITYAFPFAWSLNYLPFEMLGLPQAAQLVNLALGLIVLVTLLRLRPVPEASRLCLVVILVFLAHPFVVRTFTSALADGYAILATTVIMVGLLQLDRMDAPMAGLIGFSAWVGVGSRYQLVAVGIAATVVFAVHALRARQLRSLLYFSGGGAGALLLASPFYIANLCAFGNPVWPLLITRDAAASSYANSVAASFISDFALSPEPGVRLANAVQLFTNLDLAPIPVVFLIVIAVTLWIGDRGHRYVALFAAMFLLLWELMSPRLYPTHILPLLPAGPILLGGLIERIPVRSAARRAVHNTIATAVVVFTALSAFVAWDYARYAVTGDASEFHRYTWYYRTYDWVNRNTPSSSRFLVVVLSGHSYYLDRQYRRADPWLSGEVDWPRIASPAALDSLMSRERYDYVIFDDRNWSQFPGGGQMGEVIRSAIKAGTLVPVYRSREPLYTSRVRRTSSRSNVYVLRRNPRD
jgi:hypothetical protein